MNDEPKTLEDYKRKYEDASAVANRALIENVRLRAVLSSVLDDMLPLLRKHHGTPVPGISGARYPGALEQVGPHIRDAQERARASIPAFRAEPLMDLHEPWPVRSAKKKPKPRKKKARKARR